MRVNSDGKVHRTPAEWAEIFARFGRSGLSRDVFCEKEDIRVASFSRWHAKLRTGSLPTASPRKSTRKAKSVAPRKRPSFVEVVPPPPSASPWSIELELPGGCVLRLRT